jgi:hypothetical protein
MPSAIKSPVQRGRSYRDRHGRVWEIRRVTNAGRDATGALLPAMALAVCLDQHAVDDVDTRAPQWLNADTGRWSDGCESAIDLVSPA